MGLRVSPYVELRAHTAFSFGDGAMTPEALVRRAQALGYTAIGLTDTADLGGIIRLLEDELSVMNVVVPRRFVEAHDETMRHATFLTFLLAYGRVERDKDEVRVAGERFEAMEETGMVYQSHDFR